MGHPVVRQAAGQLRWAWLVTALSITVFIHSLTLMLLAVACNQMRCRRSSERGRKVTLPFQVFSGVMSWSLKRSMYSPTTERKLFSKAAALLPAKDK